MSSERSGRQGVEEFTGHEEGLIFYLERLRAIVWLTKSFE